MTDTGSPSLLGPGDVGTEVARLRLPPVSRATLALYAGASGDHNPMHIDSDFARSAGAPDVFAHGMLVMAYLGRLLTDRFGAAALRDWSVRFVAITPVGAELTCSAVLAELAEPAPGAGRIARLDLAVRDAAGQTKLEGGARVAL